jgi:hypothetical protein
MKVKTLLRIVIPALTILAIPPAHAADEAAQGKTAVSGKITPKLYYFDYVDGFGTDRMQFPERYNYQKGFGGDNRSGFYLDADVNLVFANPENDRDKVVLERQGFGLYNQRGFLEADTARLGFDAFYSHFRSATGGLDFLYSPNEVTGGADPSYFPTGSANTNSGYVAQFNDDSGQTRFRIDRTTYGGSIEIKPELLGNMGSATLNYDGYQRDGNRFATYVLSGGDVAGADPRALQRWRGFDMKVDEQVNKLAFNLTATPVGLFQLVYDGTMEKFDNQARNFTVADFAPLSSFLVSSTKPIHFVPDSTLLSNNLRLAKNFGSTAVAAGYGLSILDQDSFTQNQQTAGFEGGVMTNSAYLNISTGILPWAGLEGFVKYHNRDNDSTFPATGLINPAANQQLGVRIDRIESFNYGVAATFRPTLLKSTVTAGWKREDSDRDLTWTAVAPLLNGIQAQRSLYRQGTLSDEWYINWVARPLPGLIVRVTPSYLSADETALVTKPEESFNLKTKVSYAAANGVLVSGYYNYKDTQNSNNTFTDVLATKLDGASIEQDVDNTLQSAGASLSLSPTEKLSTTASLSWMQNDFESYFFSTNRRRFEGPNSSVSFIIRDRSNYLVDTYVASLGADLQATSALSFSGNYSFTKAEGRVANGIIEAALPEVDDDINEDIHSLSLGVDYALMKNVALSGIYSFDYYDNEAFNDLTGGVHTLMVGVSFGL